MSIVATVPAEEACPTCGRLVFADGLVLSVEGAWNPQHICEAQVGLLLLRNSRNKKQRARYFDLIERFEQLAAYGELDEPLQMNYLRDDLWEIKTPHDRIPFFFVAATAEHVRSARLAQVFEKKTGRTAEGAMPRNQFDRAFWILRGDRST